MPDMEKVTYDIERCICRVPDACRDCSHYQDDQLDCMEKLLADALSLLKEQNTRRCGKWKTIPHKKARVCSVCEKDEPYKFADDDADVYEYCPHCGAKMEGR